MSKTNDDELLPGYEPISDADRKAARSFDPATVVGGPAWDRRASPNPAMAGVSMRRRHSITTPENDPHAVAVKLHEIAHTICTPPMDPSRVAINAGVDQRDLEALEDARVNSWALEHIPGARRIFAGAAIRKETGRPGSEHVAELTGEGARREAIRLAAASRGYEPDDTLREALRQSQGDEGVAALDAIWAECDRGLKTRSRYKGLEHTISACRGLEGRLLRWGLGDTGGARVTPGPGGTPGDGRTRPPQPGGSGGSEGGTGDRKPDTPRPGPKAPKATGPSDPDREPDPGPDPAEVTKREGTAQRVAQHRARKAQEDDERITQAAERAPFDPDNREAQGGHPELLVGGKAVILGTMKIETLWTPEHRKPRGSVDDVPRRYGARLGKPHRVASGLGGPAWLRREKRQRGRVPSGTLLVDASGSMHWDPEELQTLIREANFKEAWVYAGRGDTGSLARVATQDRVASPQAVYDWRRRTGGGNVVDLNALTWLAKRPGPRVWISDGVVTDAGHGHRAPTCRACRAVVRSRRIDWYASPEHFRARRPVNPHGPHPSGCGH